MTTYCIVRHHREGWKEVRKTGLTLQEAKDHCKDPETSSTSCTLPENVEYTSKHGDWFDGYDEE
jgi:hypothetical protein